MQLYEPFYKRFGIRKADQLMTPPLTPLELLDLPKSSILHCVSMSPLEVGPAADEYIFRNIDRQIVMSHVTEIGDQKGTPRRLSVMPEPLFRKYHLKNRRFRLMRSLEASARDPNTLIVYNYGLLPQLYRYMRSIYAEYYRWWNAEATVWKTMGSIAEECPRQQFLMCKLPTVLPGINQLNIAMEGFVDVASANFSLEGLDGIALEAITQRTIKIFNNPESLFILELWKWFGEKRYSSVIANVPEKHLDKINLVFEESGRWFVMNLGLINSWRVATEEELKINPNANTKGIAPDQIQRRFLRLMMALFQVRTVASAEVAPVKDVKPGTTTQVVTQTAALPQIDPKTGAVVVKTQTSTLNTTEPLDAHLLEPDDTGDNVKHDALLDKQLEEDLAELERISQNAAGPVLTEEGKVVSGPVFVEEPPRTLEGGVMAVCDKLADNGLLSAAEYRRYDGLSKSYKNIIAPDGKATLDEFIQIPPEKLKIEESPALKDISTVVDKTMLKSSLLTFDQAYVKEVMPRDVAGMVLNIQNAGIAVTNYEIERVEDVLGSYDSYTVRVTPVEGASSTLRFKLPVIDDDGTYHANGVKYRMRKQRGDLPIRKIGSDRVALTSYYGKIFASRSSKRVNDYGTWLRNNIMARGLDQADSSIGNLHPGNVFDNGFEAPRLYTILAQGFRDFTLNPIAYPRSLGAVVFDLSFDHTKRTVLFGEEALATYEKNGNVIIGTNVKGQMLIVGADDTLYIGQNGNLIDYGTIETLLGLESEKAPVEFAELKVLGRTIPMAIVLGYELGLDKLMALLKVTPRRVPAGTRVNLGPEEYSIVFSDESLVFSRDDRLAAMVLGGFNEFHRTIRQYSVYEFDKPGVYLNVLESGGASARFIREIDLLYQLFIDPITRDLLIEMKEPTNFRGLLVRCCEMLLTDTHPNELDPAYMRIKGYERMAGAVYGELVRSIRAHSGRPGKSKQPIDLNPYAVWRTISQDPAIALVSDINPIQNLKEAEAVTYGGVGGRNTRSMTKNTREYHPNDMGTISESTVDSSDVAINTFLSADPQFVSLRGTSRRYKIGETGPTALLSTSALISPGADRDDPKRVNFIGIQHSHGVACSGYTQMPVRTGYEQILAHRTSDLFALTAKKAGKVLSVTETGVILQYDDGETRGIELGRRYGAAAGLTIPHDVVSELKEGQKFGVGDVLCYNKGFFEKDLLNPKNVVWKAGVMVKTVLLESTDTLEDSSAISPKVAGLLSTQMTKVKIIVINFDQSIHNLVKVGTEVNSEDILCIIEDAITADSGLFDKESLDTLRLLGAQTPQAKVKGVVERIEVFYHGDKEDMSKSLKDLVTESDKSMAKRLKAAGKKPFTGSVDEGFRVEGEPLALDTLAIKVYITADVPAGVGDKGVFCNQMKTVFGRVFSGSVKTESGKEIDAIFGQKSIGDRIVLSPEIIGTTATLLDVIGKRALKAYKS
jgi:hypothetical protein